MTTWIAGWESENDTGEEFEAPSHESAVLWIAGSISALADEACADGDYEYADRLDAQSEDFMVYNELPERPIDAYWCGPYKFYLRRKIKRHAREGEPTPREPAVCE